MRARDSQDDKGEQRHYGGADESRDRDRYEPGDEDVSEEAPVYGLPGPQPTNGDHRTHLHDNVTVTHYYGLLPRCCVQLLALVHSDTLLPGIHGGFCLSVKLGSGVVYMV